MSEPDSPRWLDEITDELRREVAVRSAWRARLLEDVARTPKPFPGDDIDERFGDQDELARHPQHRRRSITLGPLTGLAAAALFVTLGAGVTYMTMSSRTGSHERQRSALASSTQVVSPAPTPAEREVVRFELFAPRASRVSLVGSFNEWNPAATPLSRDAGSGKWVVSVRLPPGRHVYAFVVDGDVTADPDAPRAADDDFGSTNSVVFVSSPRT
jgi:AMP-activated protein kinase-like protein